jgi:hypothetical protein
MAWHPTIGRGRPLAGERQGGHTMIILKTGSFRRSFAVIASLVFTTLLSSSHAADEVAPATFKVQIVPTGSTGKGPRNIALFEKGDHFHVVVTNVSEKPAKIWKEWCSWGYFNLSLEARDAEGKVVSISKRPRGWDKNYPDPMEIAPGDHLVINVNFEPYTWPNSPLSAKSRQATIRLKAVYEIREDKYSKEMGVWTGRVSSPELEYSFRWSDAFAADTKGQLREPTQR